METAGWPTLSWTILTITEKKSVDVETKIVTKILIEKILSLLKWHPWRVCTWYQRLEVGRKAEAT